MCVQDAIKAAVDIVRTASDTVALCPFCSCATIWQRPSHNLRHTSCIVRQVRLGCVMGCRLGSLVCAHIRESIVRGLVCAAGRNSAAAHYPPNVGLDRLLSAAVVTQHLADEPPWRWSRSTITYTRGA